MARSAWLLLMFINSVSAQYLLPGQPLSQLFHNAGPHPNLLAMDSPQRSLHRHPLNQDLQTLQNIAESSQLSNQLGMVCNDNFTCSVIPNSHCVEGMCKCLPNFMKDAAYPGACKLAPGYNEVCAMGEVNCRLPFICNGTSMCDCPQGYIQEYFQCVRNCPPGHIPIQDKCIPGRQLDEKCVMTEQCMQSYSHCLHNKCQCIPGANRAAKHCYPVSQCPLGEPSKNASGDLHNCKADTDSSCPAGFYCLYAEFNNNNGFCCPKIKMNCPIGKPLENVNCTSCPWETHHCFSYVIGTYTESMCCPNACPASQPIQVKGLCYHRVAYGGNCMVDDQCFNVLGAVCRTDNDNDQSKCLCPHGNFNNYFGKCMKDSGLGEDCSRNEECKTGSNTLCLNGVCSCFQGYMPEPFESANNGPTKCIAEPSCPTATGVRTVDGTYEDCKSDHSRCSPGEFCRKWWFDGHKTYSLCCPKPNITDFENICKPFRMSLIKIDDEAVRCDIAPFPSHMFSNDAIKDQRSQLKYCPKGSSCLFDPFSINQGVCCEPQETKLVKEDEKATVTNNMFSNKLRQSPRKVPVLRVPYVIRKTISDRKFDDP